MRMRRRRLELRKIWRRMGRGEGELGIAKVELLHPLSIGQSLS